MLARRACLLLLPAVIYLAGIFSFLSYPDRFDSFPLDDAWIHQVYARSFATGHGFEYNNGAQEAGSTSPLWAIATAPIHWFAGEDRARTVAGVMCVGAALGLACILIFRVIAVRLTGSSAAACMAACLLALEPRLLFSALSGMENVLLVALWLGALLAAIGRRWWVAAVLAGLMAITRPESVVVLAVFVFALMLARPAPRWPRKVMALVIAVLPFAAWLLFCHATTGHWLPNTYYVKALAFRPAPNVLVQAWRLVAAQGFATSVLFPAGMLTAAIALLARRRWLVAAFIIVAPLLYLSAVAGTRDLRASGYYWTRWIDPVALLLTAAFALGLAFVSTGSWKPAWAGRISLRTWRFVMCVAVVAVLAFSAPGFARSFADRRSHLRTDSRVIAIMNVRAGLWIRDHSAADAVVGVNDAGAIRYFGNRRTIDLLGLNNQDLAFHRVPPVDTLLGCDWLAIFPSIFPQQAGLLSSEYDVDLVIQIPPAEYTISNSQSQTTLAVYHRKRR